MSDEIERLPNPFELLDSLLRLPLELLGAIEGPPDNPGHEEPDSNPNPISRPGCTAAEDTILVLGYLDGLADGMGGFAVLRLGKEKLEEGAMAAGILGEDEIAGELRSIADDLSMVHTEEDASALAERLRPLKAATWDLGKKCKGTLTAEQMELAKEVSAKVRRGELTLAQAIRQIKGA